MASRPGPRHSNVGLKKKGALGFDFRGATQSLWIDALSIDQQNHPEKSYQVQRMGAIYSGSTRVVAWLGKHKDLQQQFRQLKRDLRFARRRVGYETIITLTRSSHTLCPRLLETSMDNTGDDAGKTTVLLSQRGCNCTLQHHSRD